MLDSIITGIDSSIFQEAQYTGGNELYMITSKGDLIIFEVDDKEFIRFSKNPTHEACLYLLKNHPWKRV